MLEKCSHSMVHFEHMCSINLNGCAVEGARIDRASFETPYICTPCDDRSHRHYEVCTPNLIGT